ncbi:NAD(P)-dependent alcohol dehydrogenase [Couchioplanes caeruleus]|uniref:NAD(P)-dependent alcohol dehydrogenase n=1 Tax=Couchioplanes caeruleus TaxID=56438 RepID=UPI0020BDB8B8|nr:NAD(P)-dependent alcohol dehydrogenase [Couchioplanes caeruleus]UQU61848.1 NAD(P)-dependent alcohol dehydrogenase [Couchioplanes caeruleus]
MRALRLLDWKKPAELVEVPQPVPGPGQVVIKVGGAGACHSDLHLMHDFTAGQLPWGPPFTLGHENAGWVHRVGEGVTGLAEGTAVAVYGAWGCGSCDRCRLGAETYCDHPAEAPVPAGGGGLGLDGGMAEYLLVPDARHLVPLPPGLDPLHAAPLTDAGLTPYHAIRRSWPKLTPRSTALVIGVGGLGHLAVQILKATTAARVIAVDLRRDALDLARRYGADLVLSAEDSPAEAIRDATGGHGADVVLDFVGGDDTLALAAGTVRSLGDLTLVGIAGGTLPLSFFSVPYEVSIQTTYWGTRPELAEVLDLAARGMLTPQICRFELSGAVTAYDEMQAGELQGRAVIVP